MARTASANRIGARVRAMVESLAGFEGGRLGKLGRNDRPIPRETHWVSTQAGRALPIFGVPSASKGLARGFHRISGRLAKLRECSRAFYTLAGTMQRNAMQRRRR
jgi:hypothetical protein